MKKVSFVWLMAAVISMSLQAKTIQPIIFDDPSFDIHSADLSPEQRSFLAPYIHGMEKIAQGEDAEKYFVVERAEDEEDGVKVAPLLGEINFNQGDPYNRKCPYLNGGRAVTGCVATAMAQVMRYYKYPAHGTGTFTYTGGTGGVRTVNLEDMPFDWNNILPTYDGVRCTDAQADAIATLMLACGASLNMNYDKDGSSADTQDVPKLLKNNFGYNKAANVAVADGNNPEETIKWWGIEAVRPDLDLGRPLIFAGYPAVNQSGHCFVIDGYKVEGGIYYYHVNWGWGGYGNNWCLLTMLQDAEGHNYAGHKLRMVYNIYPNTQDIEDTEADKRAGANKMIKDGQLLIERNNRVYTVQGQCIQ